MKAVAIRLTLPSGRVVDVTAEPSKSEAGAPVLASFVRLLDRGGLKVRSGGEAIDATELALADVHVLAAVLAHSGILADETVTVSCHNCGASLEARPCTVMETSAWENGDASDPLLDALAPFGEAFDIAPVALGRVRTATTIAFEPRTLRAARRLFERGSSLTDVDEGFVFAMGITSLGPEKDAASIAKALRSADASAWASIQDAFLRSHYPERLAGAVVCSACQARNDIDAPYHRELGPPFFLAPEAEDAAPGVGAHFVSVETFTALAHHLASELLPRVPGDERVLVFVEPGVPDVDAGGNPLLGSYLPPPPAPTVTVYYQSFARAWEEEEGFDWEDELRETLEHELEHHVYFMRGDDPMDDEERAELQSEAERQVGAREAQRRAAKELGRSVPEFLRRTWILWLLVALAFAFTVASQR